MSDKVRMKVTITFEYDADPERYENRKPIDMVDCDRMNFEDDTYHLLDCMNNLPYTLTVEPINGND